MALLYVQPGHGGVMSLRESVAWQLPSSAIDVDHHWFDLSGKGTYRCGEDIDEFSTQGPQLLLECRLVIHLAIRGLCCQDDRIGVVSIRLHPEERTSG